MKRLVPLALLAAFPAPAQTAPDAGQTLQQQQREAPSLPRSGPAIEVQPPTVQPVPPGGQQVILRSVSLHGISVFAEAELLAVLGDVFGKPFDLTGLRTLADRISAHYRAHGYPFARAFLPPQSLSDGRLVINVVEGRYGNVATSGEEELAPRARAFLGDLKPGAVIESRVLERAVLLLDDQPGLKTAPLIRPGEALGTGDLIVDVSRTPLITGDIGIDNHGNRYTGQTRARANIQFNSPFTLGDQISLRTLATDEGQWLGSLGYSLPLGTSGLRGNVGYSHIYYELGKNFASLGAHGTAKVTSLGLAYPLVRSQKSNLTLAAAWQHKQLSDRQETTSTRNDKASVSLPVTLQFDHRDALGGGGISFGSLVYTTGRLHLDDALRTQDIASNTGARGHFDKWNVDVARLQATPLASLTLYGRISAQWAGKNLDSSESFSLGGPNGVRAYPVGEGNGDEGWFVQLEARYPMGAVTPYAFHDAGRARTNADEGRITPGVANNARSIAGSGLGLRYRSGPWHADAHLAWRNHGGKPTSDTQDTRPRLWVTVAYRF